MARSCTITILWFPPTRATSEANFGADSVTPTPGRCQMEPSRCWRDG